MGSFPRPLTTVERDVLERILALQFPGAAELRLQVPYTTAVSACECGCATIDLVVDQQRARPAACASPLPVDAHVWDENSEPIGGIIVFAPGGCLGCLEIYSHGDPLREWPAPPPVDPRGG